MSRRLASVLLLVAAPLSAQTRVCMSGDVTLGSNLDPAAARVMARSLAAKWGASAAPDSLLAPLRPLVADADVLLWNVEGAIGSGPAPRKCGPKSTACFAFRMPTRAAAALGALGREDASVVGNVANNHARDAGREGLEATRRHLERAGIHVTGLDTLATPVPTPRGDTIAVLAFYTSPDTPDARDLAAVRRHVERAVERWGTVVVSTHMGAEGTGAQRTADRREIFLGRIDRGNPVAFARTAFEAGATLVWGHGPHVMRAAEWRGNRLAFYSLGNTVTYGPFSNGEPKNRGAIACATIDSAGHVSRAELRSTVQLAPGVVRPDGAHRAAFLVDSLGRLDFPRTGARVDSLGAISKPVEAWPQGRARARRPTRKP
jgi:hypothetical protein